MIELLFTKFSVAFGHFWNKEFQDAGYTAFAKKEWEKHLQRFSDEVISTVTELCENRYRMPPTMADFIGLCSNESNRDFHLKREPVKIARAETAAFHLNKMKAILNNRR